MSKEIIYHKVSANEVMLYFAKGFNIKQSKGFGKLKSIDAIDWFFDPNQNKIIFELLIEKE